MALKILYISWHSTLEYDELKLFDELGYKWLSLGAYYHYGDESTDDKRPALPTENSLYKQYKGDWTNRESLTKEKIEPFDVLIFMHNPVKEQPEITKNWQNLRHKKCIYRSIGQSSRLTEKALAPCKKDGLFIVRYSPKEKNIPSYCGEDTMIRFYKDPEEFKDWNGNVKRVISIGQNVKGRKSACNFDAFLKATEPFERRLYGPDNENTGLIGGKIDFELLKQELRDNRVYFYCGTQPASYTLGFIEALMTGIPVVALGPKFCNRDYPEQQTYEVHEIIKNGENGFWSDDIATLQKYIKQLLEDDALAKKISENGRKTAIEYFGKKKIKSEWKRFLEGLFKEENGR